MREIKFRVFDVYAERVGQYTGLNDKNGKEIYEGYIVNIKFNPNHKDSYYKCIFKKGCFWFEEIDGIRNGTLNLYNLDKVEVIGNIYDNSELLEGK